MLPLRGSYLCSTSLVLNIVFWLGSRLSRRSGYLIWIEFAIKPNVFCRFLKSEFREATQGVKKTSKQFYLSKI